MQVITLGSYLKSARLAQKVSAIELAEKIGLESPLPVLNWEKNVGRALPLPTLRQLIEIFDLDVQLVFDLLLQYQLTRIEEKFSALERKVR